jgi:mono/diheme cytochrome c family protein
LARNRHFGKILLAALLIALESTAAFAQPDAGRGRSVVDQWCRSCHMRPGDPPNADMAPAYEDIVLLPGRNRRYFERFMAEDHFPMTTFRLFDREKADVIAYLLELQKAELAKESGK